MVANKTNKCYEKIFIAGLAESLAGLLLRSM